MTKNNIKFMRDAVVKVGDPALMRFEVAKTRRAYHIGKNCGLFLVPKILEYNECSGTIVFERLKIKPIFPHMRWGSSYIKLGEILGRSLAIIHRELVLPDAMRIPLPSEYDELGDPVFIHGDLATINICVGESWPPITIIDWQMTDMLGGQATYGTRYFDLMWFINNLIFRPTVHQPVFFIKDTVSPVIFHFLDAYFKEGNIQFNVKQFGLYAERFFKLRWADAKKNESWSSRLLAIRSCILKEGITGMLADAFKY